MGASGFWVTVAQTMDVDIYLGHFQVGSYRYKSLVEGLYTL